MDDLSNDTGRAPYLKITARLLADSPVSVFPIDIAAVPPVIPTSGLTFNAIPGAETISPSKTMANLLLSPVSLANCFVKSVNLIAEESLNSKETIHSFSGYAAIASSISLPVKTAGPHL